MRLPTTTTSSAPRGALIERLGPDDCDPNAAAVEWARALLPGIEFFVNGHEPPLELESGSLDLVFAISIWSHFNEPSGLEWLEEMRRLLRRGGALVLTTAGPKAASLMPTWGFGDAGTRACWQGLNERGLFWFDSFGAAGDWGGQARALGRRRRNSRVAAGAGAAEVDAAPV